MDSLSKKAIVLPTFSGERKDFDVFWCRVWAYGSVHGITQAMKRTVDPDLPAREDSAIDESTAEGKKQLKAKKANEFVLWECLQWHLRRRPCLP